MNWYLAALRKYATFQGRARRREYWMFVLFNIIFAVVLEILYVATGSVVFFVLYGIYGLGVLIPGISVLVRRLHDIGKSGGWFWISLVPFIGGIWLLVLTVLAGNPGPNKYGPDPKVLTPGY